jgi:hypothetical protein
LHVPPAQSALVLQKACAVAGSTDIAVAATTEASTRQAAVWVAIGVAYADRASPR